MRVLVVVGSDRAALEEVTGNHGSEVVVKLRPEVSVMKGAASVHYVAIRNERDVDRLRGLRFDLIIEDGSYNPGRDYRKGTLLQLVRMIVLR